MAKASHPVPQRWWQTGSKVQLCQGLRYINSNANLGTKLLRFLQQLVFRFPPIIHMCSITTMFGLYGGRMTWEICSILHSFVAKQNINLIAFGKPMTPWYFHLVTFWQVIHLHWHRTRSTLSTVQGMCDVKINVYHVLQLMDLFKLVECPNPTAIP